MTRWNTALCAGLLGLGAPLGAASAQLVPAPTPLSMDSIIRLGTTDLNHFWGAVFISGRFLPYRAPAAPQAYTRPRGTPCGPAVLGNAFYCPLDHGVYYDLGLMQRVYGTAGFGDFGALTILAHEWSHAVQHQLAPDLKPPRGIAYELQADCLAGAYAQFLQLEQSPWLRLERGDLEEGATTLFSLGDDLPWFHPDAHGSPYDRSLHFVIGLAEGVPACYPAALYRDFAGAFEIAYPRSWKVQHDDGWSADRQTFHKSFLMGPARAERLELHGYLSEGIRMLFELPPRGSEWTPVSRMLWASTQRDALLRGNPGFRVTATEQRMFGTYSGTLYRLEGTDPKIREPERTTFVTIATPAFRMTIELTSPASAYDYYQHRLDQLLGSLRILNPLAPIKLPS
jgi:hypothetical protein